MEQRVIYILDTPKENVTKLIESLNRGNFHPDKQDLLLGAVPNNKMRISIAVTLTEKSKKVIVENLFENQNATIIRGPIDDEPSFKIKFKDHVKHVGKGTLLLLIEGWAAVHAVIAIFMLHNSISINEIHFDPLVEIIIFLIASIPAGVHFIISWTKYEKIVE